MKCPKCDHENRDKAKFCEECGEKLQLKCPRCGSELRPDAKFCDKCGAKVLGQVSAKIYVIPKLEDMHTLTNSFMGDEVTLMNDFNISPGCS